jgi:hypothetical protein
MRFDCYDGIDGETLRLESESLDELVSLHDLFDDLAATRLSSAELTRLFADRSGDVERVMLRRVERRHFEDPEVKSPAVNEFEWRADPIDLRRYAGLIEKLIDRHPLGGYQLITAPEPRSITVEVTLPRS